MKPPITLLCSALFLATLAVPVARADDAKPATPAAATTMVTGPSVSQTGDPMPDREKGGGAAKKAKKKGKKKPPAAAAPDRVAPTLAAAPAPGK